MVLCCIATLVGNAAEVSFTFSEGGYSNAQDVSTVVMNDDIKIVLSKGSNTNNGPKYYSSGTALRLYGGNEMKFSAKEGIEITNISIKKNAGSDSGFNAGTTVDSGEFKAAASGSLESTWTGKANSVTIKNGGTSGNARISTVTVTYNSSTGVDPTVATPVFTIADSDWENEAKGVVFKGASVTLSAPEGTPEGWIMGYKLNDGADEYAEEAVTLTIDANTTVTAYINDEANAVTKTFTVAKIADLTVNPAFGAVIEGSTVEISTATEGALLHGFIGANALEGVAMPYTFSVTEPTEVNVWAENPRYLDSEVLEGAYTIRIPSATPKWEAVTSVDQLLDGDIVTFTAKEYITAKVSIPAVVMNSYNSGSSYIDCAAYELSDGEFSVSPYEFTIRKADNGEFLFMNADGKYLTHSGTKNTLDFSDSATSVSVEFGSDGNAVVAVPGTTTYKLQYYPQNSKGSFDYTTLRFSFYTTGQQNVYMYRQLQSTPVAPARPTIDGIENDNDKLNLNVGDQLTVRCEEGSTIAYIEESLTPAAIAPRAASATAEWVNTGENPYTYTVQNLGTRLSFAAVKNGVYSEPSVLTISDSGITTGIEGIEAEAAEAAVEFFNLQGVKVNNPVNGLYIRRQGSKVEKVVVR